MGEDELGAEQQRLLPRAEHEVAPADATRESQVVADHGAGSCLPADGAILDNRRAKPLGRAGPAPTMTRSWTSGEGRVFTPSARAMSPVVGWWTTEPSWRIAAGNRVTSTRCAAISSRPRAESDG